MSENIVALCIILVIDRFSKTSGALESLYAGQLAVGDQLVQLKDGGSEDIVQAVEVLLIKEVWDSGYWAPLTSSGTLLVDGFLASCYASFPHDFSQVGQLTNFLLLTLNLPHIIQCILSPRWVSLQSRCFRDCFWTTKPPNTKTV